MLSFFSKKFFLVDYLNNFVDIHNHILPGIDDGAKTVEDSLQLLKAFQNMGVRRLIASPHIMQHYYPNTPKTINSALNTVKNVLLTNDLEDLSLTAAAEHMIDDNFESLLQNNKVMPMRENYLLVEMSYVQPPLNFNDAIIRITEKNYYPILAHPERYAFLHQKIEKYKLYREQGIFFQLNMLSLGNYYGKRVKKMANWLLDNGHIDFLASDVHGMRHIAALESVSLSSKRLQQLLPIINNTIETFY